MLEEGSGKHDKSGELSNSFEIQVRSNVLLHLINCLSVAIHLIYNVNEMFFNQLKKF